MIVIRFLFFGVLFAALAACDLFPTRDAAQNAILLSQLQDALDDLERQQYLDPETPSFVLINRYGTTFGASRTLEGQSESGTPLGAEDMLQACFAMGESRRLVDIKACLRQTFASDQQLRYSHAGIAFRLPGRGWSVRQSLRSSQTGEHFQWFGSLAEFVDIPLIEPRIELVVPTLELQDRMTQRILRESATTALIDPDYNLVAGAFQTEEQMSNQFVLELLASAMQPQELPVSRAHAQAYLAQAGYAPTVVLLGGLRSIAKWDALIPSVDLDAQPYARTYEIGEFISVLSVKQFLSAQGQVATRLEISL